MKNKILTSIALLALSTEVVNAQVGDRYGCFGFYGMMGSGLMGSFGWIFMLLILVALVLFIIWLVKQLQSQKRRK